MNDFDVGNFSAIVGVVTNNSTRCLIINIAGDNTNNGENPQVVECVEIRIKNAS